MAGRNWRYDTLHKHSPPGVAGVIITGMNTQELIALAITALEDLKGIEIVEIDIREKSSIADAMIVATGTSRRHVLSLASSVRQSAKDAGQAPLGVEGEDSGDWVLVDLGDVIVHVMNAETREFYSLEKLWSVGRGPDARTGDALSSR